MAVATGVLLTELIARRKDRRLIEDVREEIMPLLEGDQ
jgi:hypothetical protein